FVRATGLPAWHPQSRGPAVAPRIRAILGTVIPRLEASQIFCSAENGAIRMNRTEKTGYGVAATHYPPSVTACLLRPATRPCAAPPGARDPRQRLCKPLPDCHNPNGIRACDNNRRLSVRILSRFPVTPRRR